MRLPVQIVSAFIEALLNVDILPTSLCDFRAGSSVGLIHPDFADLIPGQ